MVKQQFPVVRSTLGSGRSKLRVILRDRTGSMRFGFVECEEKRLNQTCIFRSIAKGFPGCMPEPRSKQNTPIEPHGYCEQMFPFRLVVTVPAGEVLGKECTGLPTELRDFAIVEWRAIGA